MPDCIKVVFSPANSKPTVICRDCETIIAIPKYPVIPVLPEIAYETVETLVGGELAPSDIATPIPWDTEVLTKNIVFDGTDTFTLTTGIYKLSFTISGEMENGAFNTDVYARNLTQSINYSYTTATVGDLNNDALVPLSGGGLIEIIAATEDVQLIVVGGTHFTAVTAGLSIFRIE